MEENREPYSMEEHIKGAQEMVADHTYCLWYQAHWRSWLAGIKSGFANWCESLRDNAKKNPYMVFSAPTFLVDQIKVAIYLKEAIRSRDVSELIELVDWVDSTCDNVDELTYRRIGLVGKVIPERMRRIQDAALEYNLARERWWTQSRVFRMYLPQFEEMIINSSYQYSDWEVEWGSDWRIFVKAAEGFFEQMGDPHNGEMYRVEAWSLCGMVAVFGSHPESISMFCSDPVCLIPVEQIVGKTEHEKAALLEQAYEKACEEWALNRDSYYQQVAGIEGAQNEKE